MNKFVQNYNSLTLSRETQLEGERRDAQDLYIHSGENHVHKICFVVDVFFYVKYQLYRRNIGVAVK